MRRYIYILYWNCSWQTIGRLRAPSGGSHSLLLLSLLLESRQTRVDFWLWNSQNPSSAIWVIIYYNVNYISCSVLSRQAVSNMCITHYVIRCLSFDIYIFLSVWRYYYWVDEFKSVEIVKICHACIVLYYSLYNIGNTIVFRIRHCTVFCT